VRVGRIGGGWCPQIPETPERRLYRAILESAYSELSHRNPSIRRRSLDWFRGAPATVSVQTVASVLCMEQEYLTRLAEEAFLGRRSVSKWVRER
jgi:hypothetical protein